jgi:methyl-accepting chemotaxis protein
MKAVIRRLGVAFGVFTVCASASILYLGLRTNAASAGTALCAGIALAVLAEGVMLALWVVRSINRFYLEINGTMERAAEGDLTVRLEARGANGFERAFNRFMESVVTRHSAWTQSILNLEHETESIHNT